MEIPQLSQNDINRFWSKVAITAQEDKCWVWTEGKRRRGYGRFCITVDKNKDKGFIAHRVAYFLAYGKCPEDKVVCHKCDNTSCCNPNHLWLGTNKENTQDMIKKKRGGNQHTATSTKRSYLDLDESEVIDIRRKYNEEGYTIQTLAYEHNFCRTTISYVVNKKYFPNI